LPPYEFFNTIEREQSADGVEELDSTV